MSDGICGAVLTTSWPMSGTTYTCVRDSGHEGMHEDEGGQLWTSRFPSETPKLSAAHIHGALDSLRGRIEHLEDWREQSADPVNEEYDVVTTLNRILVVLKDIRKAI